MMRISRLFRELDILGPNRNTRAREQNQEISLLRGDDCGLDTVSFSGNKSEKFADVRAELDNNVPDKTTTIEEKEKALSYIERMLKCSDITPEMKNYWSNKKNVIEMEVQGIKNLQETNSHQKFEDVQKEFSEFTQKYWVENIRNDASVYQKSGFEGRHEYLVTVRRTMLTYVDRILACSDIPRDEKEYYQGLKVLFKCDLNSYAAEVNYHNQSEGKKTEAFYDVLSEMRQNVPDSTRTVNEKRLAISYIERLLSCDDISNPEYWQNKLNTIEKELQALENRGTRRR